ncbi:NUDIX domain-containing protein [Aestuariimicrobium ganziense]|uniref:NUDIX domain-containing protein n=1 Tax=Aestuariimicrobium ganziense TaxID=2773677 RepID=UPI00194324A0|nr:NUDIX domain-containing protein [Aestuariimicrobium ganziense]
MIPAYHAALRAKIGNDLIWAPGAAVLVLREGADGRQELLVQQRSDTGAWNPICGSVDPGEDPDVCAVREAIEETGVAIEVTALLSVRALPVNVLPNGHVCQYLDHTFLGRPVAGGAEAHVADDESLQVHWVPVDELPPMEARFTDTLARVLSGDLSTRFGMDDRLLPS